MTLALNIKLDIEDANGNYTILNPPTPCIIKDWLIFINNAASGDALYLGRNFTEIEDLDDASDTPMTLPPDSMLIPVQGITGTPNMIQHAFTKHKIGFDKDDQMVIAFGNFNEGAPHVLITASIDLIPGAVYPISRELSIGTSFDPNDHFIVPFNGYLEQLSGEIIIDAHATNKGVIRIEAIHVSAEVWEAYLRRTISNEEGDLIINVASFRQLISYGRKMIIEKHVAHQADTDTVQRFGTQREHEFDLREGDIIMFRYIVDTGTAPTSVTINAQYDIRFAGDDIVDMDDIEIMYLDEGGVIQGIDLTPFIMYGS